MLMALLGLMSLVAAPSAYALAAGSTTPGNVSDPPLNASALFAVSGNYVYSAAGAAMRDQGYGSITQTWSGSLVKAYLVWGVINPENVGLDGGTFNTVAITGTLQSDDASPCWGDGTLWVFAADVTSLVNNGVNTLTGFASGSTDGGDPWSEAVAPLDEGASLIVVSSPTATVANQVYIYTGTYTEPYAGNPLTSTFNHGAAIATTAQTTFVVADGQLPSNYAEYNGVTIDSNAFPGSDPKASATPWSYGNLWDTKTYSTSETLGATTDSASIGANGGDCLTWAAQVIMIPSTAPIVGAPQFGAPAAVVAAMGVVAIALMRRMKVPSMPAVSNA